MPYYPYRAELSVVYGLVFKGDSIVVSSNMRKEIKEKIHQGHMGIKKCKVRARQVVFWPGINAEISEMVLQCPASIKYQQAQKKQPLKSHDVPAEPWYKVGMDLVSYRNKDYLVIVDYLSNYPEVCPLNNTPSSTIISHVKSIFARHGIPKIVISDMGHNFQVLSLNNTQKSVNLHMRHQAPSIPDQTAWLKVQSRS